MLGRVENARVKMTRAELQAEIDKMRAAVEKSEAAWAELSRSTGGRIKFTPGSDWQWGLIYGLQDVLDGKSVSVGYTYRGMPIDILEDPHAL